MTFELQIGSGAGTGYNVNIAFSGPQLQSGYCPSSCGDPEYLAAFRCVFSDCMCIFSVCLSVCVSSVPACLSVFLQCLPVCLCVFSVCLSVCLYLQCLPVCLSVSSVSVYSVTLISHCFLTTLLTTPPLPPCTSGLLSSHWRWSISPTSSWSQLASMRQKATNPLWGDTLSLLSALATSHAS